MSDATPPSISPDQRIHRIAGAVLLVVLAALCYVPFFGLVATSVQQAQEEKPAAGAAPQTAAAAKARARLKNFVNDNFLGSAALAEYVGRFKTELLHESASGQVALGRDGWLFYTGARALPDLRRSLAFPPQELALLVQWFQANATAAEQAGCQYVVLFTPSKASVHPEALPPTIIPLANESRLNRLMQALNEQAPELRVVNAYPAALAAKAWAADIMDGDDAVFQRTDTHWNDVAAFAAAEVLLAECRTNLPVPEFGRDRLRASRRQIHGGDLARFMGMHNYLQETIPDLRWEWDESAEDPSEHQVFTMLEGGTGNPDLPRAAMFRDSFAQRLVPFLNPHFQHINYAWSYHFQDPAVLHALKATRTDIIIHQISERSLADISFLRAVWKELQ